MRKETFRRSNRICMFALFNYIILGTLASNFSRQPAHTCGS